MTTFDDWLRQLAAASKGPWVINDLVRGKPWRGAIIINADFTCALLTGAIRLNPDAASALTTFTCSAPVVNAGQTRFDLSLSAAATAALPLDADASGVETFAHMFFLTPSGGTEELLVGGAIKIMGLV